MLESQQLTLVGQRVRLDVRVEDVTVAADRGKLKLILDNLLSNAIKFTPHGGTIHIHAQARREQLVLDVADTGAGIPLEERGRIFEAFYQGKSPQGGHVKGTGIGLSVVIEFVQAHGGTIEIVDGQFTGAHFRIRLPLRQPVSGHDGNPRMRPEVMRMLPVTCAALCATRLQPDAAHAGAPGAPAGAAADPSLAVIGDSSRNDGASRAATPAEQAEIVQGRERSRGAHADDQQSLELCAGPGDARARQVGSGAARQIADGASRRVPKPCCPPNARWPGSACGMSSNGSSCKLENRACRAMPPAGARAQRRHEPAPAGGDRGERAAASKALAEAQAKLDEITRIERSIIERNPGNGGNRTRLARRYSNPACRGYNARLAVYPGSTHL